MEQVDISDLSNAVVNQQKISTCHIQHKKNSIQFLGYAADKMHGMQFIISPLPCVRTTGKQPSAQSVKILIGIKK
jgi:hypothetical protein